MGRIRFFNAVLSVVVIIFLVFSFVTCCAEDDFSYQNSFTETSEGTDNDKSYIPQTETYILNIKSKKIHKTTCGTGDLISPENRRTYKGDIDDLFEQGYTLCGNCYR